MRPRRLTSPVGWAPGSASAVSGASAVSDNGGGGRARPTVLARRFYATGAVEVAPRLLNKLLVRDGRAGRIVEVEAYRGSADPASHAFRGITGRNATMFGPPGRLYVYFTYGMHFCANVVCMPEGTAEAVLLRALAPVEGLDAMRAARPGVEKDTQLASGPAKLCQAMGIAREHDGVDLVTSRGGLRVMDDGVPPTADPAGAGRGGISPAPQMPV